MKTSLLTGFAAVALLAPAWAQETGPSSSQSPYVLPVGPLAATTTTKSLLSAGDLVGSYKMVGIPDGLGAFDNGDGTFTLLMNHELTNTKGVTRAHGSIGGFVSKWVINKNTLAVNFGVDLIQTIYPWDFMNNVSSATPATTAFSRFCSADLPAVTAFYNASTGLGTQERIFMNGEEDAAAGHGRCYAHVVTGANAGKSYELGRFMFSSSDLNASENCLANPFAQNKTLVMIDNDGGTPSTVNNKVLLYVGTKTNTGTEADKAGLTNGTLKFIAVAGSLAEIVNTTTRATNIVSGTAFTLSSTTAGGTTFSRPEDGAWNPFNPKQYYFVTTDQIDQVTDGVGSQIGRSRLWRLTFADLSNPDAGGVVDLLLDGTEGQNMLDNLTVGPDGHLILQEDVGGAEHNGKIWEYNPEDDTLTLVTKHDAARFGDIAAGGTVIPATAPFTNDEETSGVIDITALMAGSALSTGRPNEQWFLSSDQAHSTTNATTETVENGQLFAIHRAGQAVNPPPVNDVVSGGARGGKLTTQKSTFRVKGVASSNAGIVKVEYRLKGEKKFRKAKGTVSWSFNAALEPGKNKFLVRITSASGKTIDKTVVVTRK